MKKRHVVYTVIIVVIVAVLLFLLRCGGIRQAAVKIPQIIKEIPKTAGTGQDYVLAIPEKASMTKGRYGIWVVKIDSRGNTQWTKTFGSDYYEWAESVIPVKDGGYIVASKTYTFGEGYDGINLMKLDSKGNMLWVREFDDNDDKPFSEPLGQGSLIAGRTYAENDTGYGVYLAKTGRDGDYLWMKTFGNDYLAWGYTAVSTENGSFVTTAMEEDFLPADGADVYLVRRDKSGEYSWTRKFGGDKYDRGYSVEPAADGGFIISGITFSYGAGEDDFYIIKTDREGKLTWENTYGGAGRDRAYDAQQALDGGFIAAGATTSYGSGGYDAYVVKVDRDGDTIWAKAYGGAGDDSAHSIALTKDGGYIFAGASNSK